MKDIATVSTTKYILDKYNLNALKKFGQNFLVDTNIINNIITEAKVDNNTVVLEVGVGLGSLTQQLSNNAYKVFGFEIDERFKEVHQEFLNRDNIEIIYGDYLKTDIKDIINSYQDKRIIMISNVPYYITTDIIKKTLESSIQEMYLMVQKEVAIKFSSDTKMPLNMMIDYLGGCKYLFTVSKQVFIPKPNVDSAIMYIYKDKEYNPKLYSLLQDSFTQKRKTIYNNLKGYPNIKEYLLKAGIQENDRAENIPLDKYLKLLEVMEK
ncbi:MAG: 16S rRNA (adenine(1518)-N(6)/adenine(1519)-N(6))-dimethyltransferase RsmA [Thomasclavelia sp.]|nr:16S rRNA (adenine(1518)-N(6)/adenine(1519)-N(6))-dimethyltransferase RsmA [Thomasclavelia sp.]